MGEAAAAPRNVLFATRSRVPVYRSAALSSMELADTVSGRFRRKKAPAGPKLLGMRRCDLDAVVTPHEDAVLGSSQMGDAHGEPYADRQQRQGERERCH